MRALPRALAILSLVALAACGTEEQERGEIVISQSSQPDRLDPALSYSVNAWEPLWLVYTPLLTYRHAEGEKGAELVPGLAGDLPEISEDGTTYRLTLREGLSYSDGTDVVASDFEHTIRRVLHLESGGLPFYDDIAGAKRYIRAGDPEGDISGIETDDETGEITIALGEPDATFSNVLAMNFAGLVPGDTPFRNMTASPPPGVGPYEITESVPNRHFVLERHEGFGELDIPDIPTGNIDKITTRIIRSEREQAQDVLDNQLDYMQDPPPPDLKPTVIEQAGDRYEEHPTVSTYYFFLNHRTAPFDDPKVREAVNHGLDRSALARLYAGTLKPGCAFLAPGMPGYDEALDTTECPYGNPTEPPDVARARELISEAGAGGTRVIVWGSNEEDTQAVTEAYAEMLSAIGLEAEPRIIDAGIYYATIENQKTSAQTGFNTWFQDFPHPLNFYLLVDGDSIQPTNNPNPGNVDDPFIDEELGRLRGEADVQDVVEDWRELDRYVVGPPQSHLAPFGHKQVATFLSERIEPESAIFHPLYRNDYSSWRLKEGG